jgi:hypothetical protein
MNNKLKTTDIGKGKEYVQVDERLRYLRENYPLAALISEMVSNEDGVCIFKTSLMLDAEVGVVVATGHAYEKEGSSFINKTSYIENAETSSWGRCLANFGIGIQCGVASANEVANAVRQQEAIDKAGGTFLSELSEAIGESNIVATAEIWGDMKKHADGKVINEFVQKHLSSSDKSFITEALSVKED